jgi:D-sedoheptulose 7-phosphate isomerase
MGRAVRAEALGEYVGELLARRTDANRRFFESEAERLARCCHRMAERFSRGGRLVALGRSPQARSDARHVAVEFVHPVIVGKRALPAIGLAGEGGPLADQLDVVAEPDDIVMAFETGADPSGETAATLRAASERGCLTIAFEPAGAEWEFEPPADDPFVRQELIETLYHVLWELVHVFFEHRGLLEGRDAGPRHEPGASGFLYPFLSEGEHDLEAVIEDVRRSVLMKSDDVGALREQTLTENRQTLLAAAADLRRCFETGGKALAFGNGGSATDAMDVVADFRSASPRGGRGTGNGAARPPWRARRAIDLTEDAPILTAVANDISVEVIFQRQVIAYGHAGDAALALSTSGNSINIIEALAEARKRDLLTVAFVGYDGGRVSAEALADHIVVTRSQHIPRIQEAQASGYHVLRELVELVGDEA